MTFKLPMRRVTLLLELLLTVPHELEMAFRKSFAWHHSVVPAPHKLLRTRCTLI